jgi:hypothetical protein
MEAVVTCMSIVHYLYLCIHTYTDAHTTIQPVHLASSLNLARARGNSRANSFSDKVNRST